MRRLQMLVALLGVAAALLGCGLESVRSGPPVVETCLTSTVCHFHDHEAQVTCWERFNGGISCLPDAQVAEGGRR